MIYDYEGKSATTKKYSTFKVVFSFHLCTCITFELPTYLNHAIFKKKKKKVIDIYN